MISCMLQVLGIGKRGVELGLDLQTPEPGRVQIAEWVEFGRALNFSAFC